VEYINLDPLQLFSNSQLTKKIKKDIFEAQLGKVSSSKMNLSQARLAWWKTLIQMIDNTPVQNRTP